MLSLVRLFLSLSLFSSSDGLVAKQREANPSTHNLKATATVDSPASLNAAITPAPNATVSSPSTTTSQQGISGIDFATCGTLLPTACIESAPWNIALHPGSHCLVPPSLVTLLLKSCSSTCNVFQITVPDSHSVVHPPQKVNPAS